MSRLADVYLITVMSRALHGVDLDNPGVRAAAYIGADIDLADSERLDRYAREAEMRRRRLLALVALSNPSLPAQSPANPEA